MINKNDVVFFTVSALIVSAMFCFLILIHSLFNGLETNALEAKCQSVDGVYGGGKCFVDGVEVRND